MILIACVDLNWGIGYKNNLLVNIPNDLKRFKKLTINKTIVMGRNTLESLPNSQPLRQRNNIVISTKLTPINTITYKSIDEFLNNIDYISEDVFVIGGESIYKQLLPYCNKAYITKVYKSYKSDTYMTNLDKCDNWVISKESESKTYNDLTYKFLEYERIF